MFFLVASALLPAGGPASSASPSDFTAASGSIGAAYLAVSQAQQSGGNVTGLVASLNVALGLYTRAQAENRSDPARASSDLQNATLIAQTIEQDAPVIGQAGAAARQTQEYVSAAAAAAIVAVAGLLYFFGERIYHRLWLRLYSGYTVKKVG